MAIDWGRMAKGVATGYLGAKIANTEANDALNADIIRAAGLEYYTKTLPDFKDTEKNRATAYKQISTYFDSEQAADYFDANGFITGDGKDLERIQTLLENKKIKKDAFKDYIPTTNYADRYSTRVSSVEERSAQIHQDLGMRQGGIGPSVIEGLVTKPMGESGTTTETITTPETQVGPVITPEKTDTITSTIPRTTEMEGISTFFTPKTSVLDLGKETDIAASVGSHRGFGEGIKTDQFGITTIKFAGSKNIEYNAFKNVMNDLSSQYETADGKVNLSMVAEAADTQLSRQTQGTIARWVTDDFTSSGVKGQEVWTASGFNEDFNSTFPTDTEKKQAMAQQLASLGNKSEQQYFAISFPRNVTFSNGASVRDFLMLVTK
tara:strand:- start:614 stop:1750 length:1137 start_codon:yes stop_codon:yes gene_type:complete